MTTERRKTDPVVHARDCWRVYGTAVRPDGCEGHDFIDGIQQDIEPDPLYDALIAARDLEGMLHALRQNGENETDDCGNEIPAVETLYWALRGYLEWQGTSLIREEPKSLTMHPNSARAGTACGAAPTVATVWCPLTSSSQRRRTQATPATTTAAFRSWTGSRLSPRAGIRTTRP